jgi:hypothetical protein
MVVVVLQTIPLQKESKILTNTDCRKLYNDAALDAMTIDMNYEEFNDAICQSGMNTAIFLKERCEGWYEFSQTELMQIIKEKNRLVHTLQQKVHSAEATDSLQGSLKCVTKQVKDKVSLPNHAGIAILVCTFMTCK